jgi:TolA-binding protein
MNFTPRLLPVFSWMLVLTGLAQVAPPGPPSFESATPKELGDSIVAENRGMSAMRAGFSYTAVGIFSELISNQSLAPEVRHRITMELITACLDAGEFSTAEKALRSYDGPPGSQYHLLSGLVAANAQRLAEAKAALAKVNFEELSAADRGWGYVLQALVADADGDLPQAKTLFEQAGAAAVSALQRARFVLGEEQALLKTGLITEAEVTKAHDYVQKLQGTRMGYDWVVTYAAALAQTKRETQAWELLRAELARLPPSEKKTADRFHLVMGLIAGENTETGQQAFLVLRNGSTPDAQRLGLQVLARSAKSPESRRSFRAGISEMLAAQPTSPISEDLLLARAQVALLDQDYVWAETDARRLMDTYPASTLKTAALGVRLSVAWIQNRYRTVADFAAQIRNTTSDARDRAELRILIAEAFFRAKDYRSAADTYDAAVHGLPSVVPAGTLLFQVVQSNILADQLDLAAAQLDKLTDKGGADPVSRWQAEWNLITAMQAKMQTAPAYARVGRLLAGSPEGVPDELRVRVTWLRAKLAFDNNEPAETLKQISDIEAMLGKADQIKPDQRSNIVSNALLLKSQACFALNRDKEGAEILSQLRSDHQATAAAQYSYLMEAGYLRQRGDIAKAQAVLLGFVGNEKYKGSEYAPLALYEAAEGLEKQGLDGQLNEAYGLLEKLIKNYPNNDLIFYARLKQGDLLRKLNDFPAARQIYEYLINDFPGHPGELAAQLALADCLFAQGSSNPVNHGSASAIYERLRDLPSAPVAIRIEAGFKLGYALARSTGDDPTKIDKKGQATKAQQAYQTVVDMWLKDPAPNGELGEQGLYWISRTLLELAQIQEDTGQLDAAEQSYRILLDHGLRGDQLARAKLAQLHSQKAGKPGP